MRFSFSGSLNLCDDKKSFLRKNLDGCRSPVDQPPAIGKKFVTVHGSVLPDKNCGKFGAAEAPVEAILCQCNILSNSCFGRSLNLPPFPSTVKIIWVMSLQDKLKYLNLAVVWSRKKPSLVGFRRTTTELTSSTSSLVFSLSEKSLFSL